MPDVYRDHTMPLLHWFAYCMAFGAACGSIGFAIGHCFFVS